jgi:molybdopterin-dependent oxidoreductase alpha subunit
MDESLSPVPPSDADHPEPAAVPPDVFTGLHLHSPKTSAAGATAVVKSMQHVWDRAGVIRGTRALSLLNQIGGVDCSSCAWPEPDQHRSSFEFCENGAKAIAWEADRRGIGREFFAEHSVRQLAEQSDYWHGQQGRLTEPLVLRPGDTHYRPIHWDEAFKLIADELNALASPQEALFYTSGRTSNEAAFLYQLFVRQFGTNNLPDCSDMCHESSSVALPETVGIGKGTVLLDDFEKAQLLLLLGQNPGTNHPRMLTALQKAKRAGAKIIAVNPLKEAGLLGFMNPQEVGGMAGRSTPLADDYLQVRINGDAALLKGWMKRLIARDRIDKTFIDSKTNGFTELVAALNAVSWDDIETQSGLTRQQIEATGDRIAESERIIACWAMGLTQHKSAVNTIRDVVNVILMRGSVGKPGAGLCPVRGHSNVQGDRTMGVSEKPPMWIDKLATEFAFTPPTQPGFDTVESIRAMHDGRAKVFFALGGNFLQATPDTEFTAAALRKCNLTVQVSIKLNRSHLVTGKTALILPCLARTDRDMQAGGPQFVTTENSMGIVQRSEGKLEPVSKQMLSEPVIVARLAAAVLGNKSTVPWVELAGNYDLIRERIQNVIPGFDDFNRRVREPGGFYLPNKPRGGEFSTSTGKARFTVSPLPTDTVQPGELVMMTIRTHDQFNTTVYGLDDRYRGIINERRVILMNKADIGERGLKPNDVVDLANTDADGTRVAKRFLVIEYDIPKGNCATYFPETNVLVPLGRVADGSRTPTSKFVPIRVTKSG